LQPKACIGEIMTDKAPSIRRDVEFVPLAQGGRQYILVRDPLGLVPEGKAFDASLAQLLALLDGKNTIRDLQMAFMRQRGGLLVGTDEVLRLLADLDHAFLLETERYAQARGRIVAEFASRSTRPCVHCGQAYPRDAAALRQKLDETLDNTSDEPEPEGRIVALVAPHIDLSVGSRVYGAAYRPLRGAAPQRVVVLGVGHSMGRDLFCVTDKAFETPLGVQETDKPLIDELRRVGLEAVAENDFAHRGEHSIEFQLILLQHVLATPSWTMISILCGPIVGCLREYSREAYVAKAGPFLEVLAGILDEQSLLVVGVDFSHIGPKFGHEMPADYLARQSEVHDRALLDRLCARDADQFWEESRKVGDRFNVCGFSALACLLELLPSCEGRVLDYTTWHEGPTRSAVSFAAAAFRAK
jgi:AmmeMemoRadiSam system protein B